MAITLGFHGAAGTVTGSRHLLDSGHGRVLVDCGMFQGLKALRELNWKRPTFDPRSVDAVVLTHAHIDHSGYLPRLVREGFRGPIFCTAATAELADLLLLDAAHLQEEDAEFANRKGFSRHKPALPLFTEKDAAAALRLFRPVNYHEWFTPARDIRTRFTNAGHILGSAVVEARVAEAGQETTIAFSGDLGRSGVPLHPDPEPLPECDTLVVESTYGDRLHDARPLSEQLGGPFRETLKHGGIILIPAFAVARAQLVTLILRDLIEAGELPETPINIDSPMAVDVTNIYSRHLRKGELDADVGEPGLRSLFPRSVQLTRTVEESKALNKLPGPRIIIAASGMLTGGRVLHHLARILPDRRNLLVLVGYQAAGTRGRALQDGAKTVRVHGVDVPVVAKFMSVDGLSAHADRDEILAWVKTAKQRPATTFLVHGEDESTARFAETFKTAGFRTIVPTLGQTFEYVASSRTWRDVRG
jgi:metallo-beta-lactamase family protein